MKYTFDQLQEIIDDALARVERALLKPHDDETMKFVREKAAETMILIEKLSVIAAEQRRREQAELEGTSAASTPVPLPAAPVTVARDETVCPRTRFMSARLPPMPWAPPVSQRSAPSRILRALAVAAVFAFSCINFYSGVTMLQS